METNTYELVAEDITALRLADSITFHQVEGRSCIRTHLDGPPERIYSARQQATFTEISSLGRVREIATDAEIRAYRNGDESGWNLTSDPQASAFYTLSGAAHNRAWRTIITLIQRGYSLKLVWIADNNTDTLRDAGLHADELELEVFRGEKSVLRFNIGYQVGRGGPARMISRHG